MTALHTQTMTELLAGLEAGEFSSVELTQALLERIGEHDEKLNALITVTSDSALVRARSVNSCSCDSLR